MIAAPRYVFGLLVRLVWLYLEILRLVAKARSRLMRPVVGRLLAFGGAVVVAFSK